jgi:hypothetical protein
MVGIRGLLCVEPFKIKDANGEKESDDWFKLS